MVTGTGRSYTRVAVVQLDIVPAALLQHRSPLEDPLFEIGAPDGLAPISGDVSPSWSARLEELRKRVRGAYVDQLRRRLWAALEACRAWGVKLVVCSEYSVPLELVVPMAEAFGDMVIVAGTHGVERLRSRGVYDYLGAPLPTPGTAVAPVLYGGRIVALPTKLNPAKPEVGSLVSGTEWSPVALAAEGMSHAMGVLVCLDFLYRESPRSRELIGAALDECRFLAVPSLTPLHSLPEFDAKGWEEARRYGRPVLYANCAQEGGTSIFVDDGRAVDLRRFPSDAPGLLERGDEGVVVADVNLGFERVGSSTRYDHARALRPVALASLVYRHRAELAEYAEWLDAHAPMFDDDRRVDDALRAVGEAREVLLRAGGAAESSSRSRRIRQLVSVHGRINTAEELRRYLREVIVSDDTLPLAGVRAALQLGAAEAINDWLREDVEISAEFVRVAKRLRESGQRAMDAQGVDGWLPAARETLQELQGWVAGRPLRDGAAAVASESAPGWATRPTPAREPMVSGGAPPVHDDAPPAPAQVSPPPPAPSPAPGAGSAGRSPMYSPADRDRLVELLLACNSVHSEGSWEQIISRMDRSIVVRIRRDPMLLRDVTEVATTCLGQRDGLFQLLSAVYYVDGDTYAWAALAEFGSARDDFYAPADSVCSAAEVRALAQAIDSARLSDDALRAARQQIQPRSRVVSATDPVSTPLLLAELNRDVRSGQGQLPPIFDFARRAAAAPHASALAAWSRETERRHGLGDDATQSDGASMSDDAQQRDDDSRVALEQAAAEVITLLRALFDAGQLKQLIASLPGGFYVLDELPGNASLADMAFEGVHALRRHGILDASGERFFSRLRQARPHRVDDIDRVAQRWRDANR
ncbi:MAG: hypothetical protein Tsb0020_13270 [Haliangiales bacterium]